MRGPGGTPCAGTLIADSSDSFPAGEARFTFGPHPSPPPFTANTRAYRAVTRWCAGRYTGRLVRSNQSAFGGSRTFSFRVAAPQGAPGRRLDRRTEQAVTPRPPVNPKWFKTRQLPGPFREMRLDLEIAGRDEQRLNLFLALPPVACADAATPGEAFLVFRPGPATIILGGQGVTKYAPNARRVPARLPLCKGRWVAFLEETPFTFVIR